MTKHRESIAFVRLKRLFNDPIHLLYRVINYICFTKCDTHTMKWTLKIKRYTSQRILMQLQPSLLSASLGEAKSVSQHHIKVNTRGQLTHNDIWPHVSCDWWLSVCLHRTTVDMRQIVTLLGTSWETQRSSGINNYTTATLKAPFFSSGQIIPRTLLLMLLTAKLLGVTWPTSLSFFCCLSLPLPLCSPSPLHLTTDRSSSGEPQVVVRVEKKAANVNNFITISLVKYKSLHLTCVPSPFDLPLSSHRDRCSYVGSVVRRLNENDSLNGLKRVILEELFLHSWET